MDADERTTEHMMLELGLRLQVAGDGLDGRAPITPEMHVPGTTCLRTSILAAWTDTVVGLLAVQAIGPRVPVTLDLEVHLHRELRDCQEVHAVGRLYKVGRSVIVGGVEFADGNGEPLATSSAAFMAAPDETLSLPPGAQDLTRHHQTPDRRLSVPFAERARCERRSTGVAELPRSEDGLNAAGTINGALVALLIEEAALSAAPAATTIASMTMRYLRPARVGPAVARAAVRSGLARVEVRDAGSNDRLTATATTRAFPPAC